MLPLELMLVAVVVVVVKGIRLEDFDAGFPVSFLSEKTTGSKNLLMDVVIAALSVVLVLLLRLDGLGGGFVGTPAVAADATTFAVVCIPLPMAYKKSVVAAVTVAAGEPLGMTATVTAEFDWPDL